MDRHRREDFIVAALLTLLVIASFANVVFGGRSLVASDSHNPLDYRMRGPNAVPIKEWTSRGLVLYPNFRDLAILTIALSVMKLLGLPPMQWVVSVPFLPAFWSAPRAT